MTDHLTLVITRDNCKACALCVHHCPKEILTLSDDINSLGYHPVTVTERNKCTACGRCALMCPDMAITLERVSADEKKVNER